MKDALIIGQGIAGTTVSYALIQRGWKVDVIDNVQSSTASKIASGLYNPLVLKRRRVVWKAVEMLEALLPFYSGMEELSTASFLIQKPVWEILPDIRTENNWMELADKPKFESMIGNIIPNTNLRIKAAKLGEVSGSGRVNVEAMIEAWSAYLKSIESFQEGIVAPSDVKASENGWEWNGVQYSRVIWCNGYKPEHPHFPNLSFSPTKGEVLIVKAPDLQLSHILHGNMFIMPWGDDHYKVGATYSWDELDTIPTEAGKTKLMEAWDKLVECPYEIVHHQAGIRPNVTDRKPLIGQSSVADNVYTFNGLGSRGILLAPWLAEQFADYLINGTPLPEEVDVKRFNI